jgi:NAD(P)-dependent dehydrogenase (short-subunit alcohol dehydrogenase family)
VNIVDIHAERPLPEFLVYSVAKAGLAGLTRALALELGPDVRVNGVAPGAILWPDAGKHFDPAERDRILATTPLGRIGSPEDVAGAVKYLLFDAPFVERPGPRRRRRPIPPPVTDTRKIEFEAAKLAKRLRRLWARPSPTTR